MDSGGILSATENYGNLSFTVAAFTFPPLTPALSPLRGEGEEPAKRGYRFG
jgi:hypothetical protein